MRTALTDLLGVEHPLVGFNRSPGVVAAVSQGRRVRRAGRPMYTPGELDAQLTGSSSRSTAARTAWTCSCPATFAPGDPADLIASLRAQIPDVARPFVARPARRATRSPARPRPRSRTTSMLAGFDAGRGGRRCSTSCSSTHRAGRERARHRRRRRWSRAARRPGSRSPRWSAGRSTPAASSRPGVDVLVAQGTEAGGHTGTIATMVLTPEIVDLAGDVPVLAAGGIASGRQMAAALALGAAGVWCGSVWLSSAEDITPNQAIKRKFLAAASGDTLRSPARTGKPARQLRSAWHDEWERPGSPAPLPDAAAAHAGRRGLGPDRRGRRGRAPGRDGAGVVLHRAGGRRVRRARRARARSPGG